MFIQNSIEKNFREITGKLALIIITDQFYLKIWGIILNWT